MDTPTMDTIYQAISALYDNPNASEKEKASQWLADVQKSIHSWKIADELLHQKKDLNSCYFAAQTMRSKVQHNLNELPPDALVSLRDSLVVHLEKTSPENSSTVLTQLSLAVADLALQMPAWQNCITDIIKSFSNKNDYALLELLTVLPQEVDSSNLKLGENRREDIKNELRANANVVTMFLKESIASSQKTHVALKIVKCMTSWIQVKAINILEVPQNAIIGFSLQVLRDHNSINTLHDAATDCICALLHCLEESNNEDVEKLLFDSVAGLEESYHMAVAHEEDQKASNFARVFTELAESFLEKIIICMSGGTPHFAMRSLELALVCVGHHDYEVAEITFNLWYRLSEEVYQRDYAPLTDAFKPHIERLIEALARHCQCEPDHTQLPDEGDEFHEFRMKVMGLIKDVVFIVGSSSVFRQMFSVLHADMSWEQTEAALFVMQSVAKNILPDEYEYVPKVVEAILSMPPGAHIAVRKTCILLLGELCEWIERHPSCLEPCLQFLVTALHEKQLASAAATALQSVTAACRVAASAHVATLQRAARSADALALEPAAAAALLRALAKAIGALPHEQLTSAMREAVSVQVAGLNEVLTQGRPVRKGTRTDPSLWLDRLAALFRDVDVAPAALTQEQHPCVPALADAWPVLLQALEKHARDGRVAERWCRALRFGVRCGGRRGGALALPLSKALRELYADKPHSCVLYLTSVMLDELAQVPSAVPPMVDLIRDIMPRAFMLLQEEGGLKNNPDTVDDLFRLCIRFLQRLPREFLTCGVLDTVLQCALLAAALDHREANSSVMKFLYDLARLANRNDNEIKALLDPVMSTYGGELTWALVSASTLHLHPYMLGEVGDVLLELCQLQCRSGADWLNAALQRLPHDQPAAATRQQCAAFHQYALRAEKCKEMTRLLRDFARLYR